jgi:DNA-binding LytR/AlgR family response regulator
MFMVNILVVEDDKLQAKNLIKMIKESKENVSILQAESENEALIIANETIIDIFFLDISLKDSSGLNLAYKLREIEKYKLSWIIFVTTLKQHMFPAFKEIHCYDYLIKPYSKNTVLEMTRNLIDDIKNKEKAKTAKREYVVFDSNNISIKIYLEDIYFIEVRLRTTVVHTVDGQYEINRMSLKSVIEKICNNNYLLQAHRSYVINLKKINKIEKESVNAWKAYFQGYNEIAFIGSKYKENLDKFLNDFM